MPPRSDHARALNDYNRAVELDTDDHDLYNDRGSSYAELGDLDKALADFDKAIALKPDYALGPRQSRLGAGAARQACRRRRRI